MTQLLTPSAQTIQKTVKFVTTQEILHDKPPISGFPVRKWSVAVAMDDGQGNEVAPPFIDRVIFKLHPTFANPNKSEHLSFHCVT